MRAGSFVVALLLAAGCDKPSPASDGGLSDLAAMSASDMAALPDLSPLPCNDLSLAGTPTVTVPYVAMNEPPMSGGSLIDGTYFTTDGNVYTGPGGMTGTFPGTFRGVYRFSGATVALIVETPAGTTNISGTFSTTGNSITFTPTCGQPPGAFSNFYSTTGTGLLLGTTASGVGSVFTLTKQ
jgi:hypothetical protein